MNNNNSHVLGMPERERDEEGVNNQLTSICDLIGLKSGAVEGREREKGGRQRGGKGRRKAQVNASFNQHL